jgi:hypothetical protein
MRCRQRAKRYAANYQAPWPGGFSSPGELLIVAEVLAVGAAAAFWLGGPTLRLLAFLAGPLILFVLVAVLTSWADCRSPAGIRAEGDTTTGENCPHCGTRNTIWPWSL